MPKIFNFSENFNKFNFDARERAQNLISVKTFTYILPNFFSKNGGEIERKRCFSGFVLFWKTFSRGINVRNLKIKELSSFEK